jgi:hypothetical protein
VVVLCGSLRLTTVLALKAAPIIVFMDARSVNRPPVRSPLPLTAFLIVFAILGSIVYAGPRSADASGTAAAATVRDESGIRLGVGMAGVRIGMTRSEVRNVLGPPRRVTVIRNSAFGPGKPVRFQYPGLRVLFWKGAPRNPSGSKPPDLRLRVAATSTVRRSLKTGRGLGVGSSERQVRQKFPAARCETLTWNRKRVRNCHGGNYNCKTPSWALGDLPCRVSAFILNRKNGRVIRVAVGWLGAYNGTI